MVVEKVFKFEEEEVDEVEKGLDELGVTFNVIEHILDMVDGEINELSELNR